jgi:hypothetical protein
MAITRVREGTGAAGSGAAAVTLAGTPTNGNLLVAFVTSVPAAPAAANGFARLTPIASPSDDAALFWKLASGEGTTVTPTADVGGAWLCGLAEYSTTNGWDATQPEAGTANADADATKTTTGTADPTDGVERLVIGAAYSDGATTFSTQKVNGSTTSVNEVTDSSRGTSAGGETESIWELFEASTVAGSYTSEGVAGRVDDGSAHIAIFKPIAGAPAQDAPELRGRPFGLLGSNQLRQLIVQ